MTETIHLLMLGALVMAYLVAGGLFLKFWRLSRDRFFIWFASAFAIFGVTTVIRAITADSLEHTYYVYIPRLIGFLMISYAIFEKNRRGAS